MGTIPRPPRAGMPVPPPPAPTSRDANPWEISANRVRPRSAGLRVDPARIPARIKLPPAATVPSPQAGPQQKPFRLRWLPVAVFGGVFLAVGSNAIEAFRHGDFIGALVPLVFVGFIAFSALRSLLRKRS